MSKSKFKREFPLHMMLLPSVIVVLIYSYGPMLGISMAFQKFIPARGMIGQEWVGFNNFRSLFATPDFVQVVFNTVYMAFFKLAGGIIVPVLFALLLNEVAQVRVKRLFQTLVYLPNFLSWVILSGLMIDLLSPSTGIFNLFITKLGFEAIYFLGDKNWFPITMIVSDIWKGFGFGTVVYLAALTGIDPALYEAARVDGANRWRQTLHITLPGMKGIVVLMSVLSFGNLMNAGFDQIYNLYSPQVYSTGDILDTLVYRLGIQQAQYSVATAIGLFKSVISSVFVVMSYYLADQFAGYRIF
ncbi:MAG: ABC transporter permease subunit [Clostridiales bacterium]|jgi:putative aldouronate transport system permease protein|nr:ABC transporter permease subunit [Clostridiales bacterium]